MSIRLRDLGPELKALFGMMLESPEQFSTEVANDAVRVAGEEVRAKAIELAPYRTGELEGSSELVVGDGRAEITFGAGHAAEVHELPDNARGPGTMAKPGNELGPAGPKYLERPIIAMQERLTEIAGVALTQKLEEELG